MAPNEKDRVLSRVRKMLALANDAGTTEGERDNAMRMAHATLAKYNLELIDEPAEKDDRGRYEGVYYSRPWSRSVSQSIGKLFFCHYVYVQPQRSQNGKHYFIGREANAMTALAMASYIIDSIDREASKAQRLNGANHDYWRAFCWGAATTISRRVTEMQVKAPEAAPGTALVLANLYQVESQANQAWLQANMKLGKSRPSPGTRSSVGHAAGAAFGATVGLNRPLSGTKNSPKMLT